MISLSYFIQLLIFTLLFYVESINSFQKVMPCYSTKLIKCYKQNITKDISCYKLECFGECDEVMPYLNENFDGGNKSIYFIESSCNGGLNSRQACAIESAALTNPRRKLYVLFVGPLKEKFLQSKIYKTLKALKVNMYRIRLKEFAENTPLEGILDKFLKYSLYPVSQCSDFLKLLTMFKYGGVYLDLDVIVVKSFDTLLNNFIARQSEYYIASGVMGVSKDAIGREFIDLSIQDLAEHHDPRWWNGNSNDIYTRTLQRICETENVLDMHVDKCKGFQVLGSEYFYPIKWEEWITYYEDFKGNVPEYDQTYVHHVWNAFGGQIDVHPNSYYARLAEKFCPKIYQLFGENFGR